MTDEYVCRSIAYKSVSISALRSLLVSSPQFPVSCSSNLSLLPICWLTACPICLQQYRLISCRFSLHLLSLACRITCIRLGPLYNGIRSLSGFLILFFMSLFIWFWKLHFTSLNSIFCIDTQSRFIRRAIKVFHQIIQLSSANQHIALVQLCYHRACLWLKLLILLHSTPSSFLENYNNVEQKKLAEHFVNTF